MISPEGTETIKTAVIMIRLNAADPIIAEGPNSPGADPRVETVSIIAKRISGALEPRAIKVILAIVGFHTETL